MLTYPAVVRLPRIHYPLRDLVPEVRLTRFWDSLGHTYTVGLHSQDWVTLTIRSQELHLLRMWERQRLESGHTTPLYGFGSLVTWKGDEFLLIVESSCLVYTNTFRSLHRSQEARYQKQSPEATGEFYTFTETFNIRV